MWYFFLILALLLNAIANILLKISSEKVIKFHSLLDIITNFTLIMWICLFALNVIFYFFALSKINLSIAYPIMTVWWIIIITLFSSFFFKEQLSTMQIKATIHVLFLRKQESYIKVIYWH